MNGSTAAITSVVSSDAGQVLSTWVVVVRAEFDQYLDEPLPMSSVTLRQDSIIN